MKRKKRLPLLLTLGVLLCGLITVAVAGAGSDTDPFVTLGWLKNIFLPQAEQTAQDHTDELLSQMENGLLNADLGGEDLRVKRGDVILLGSGSSLTPLIGGFSISASGTVLDVTDGVEIPLDGAEIKAFHRYMAAENTNVAFTVNTDTAVIQLNGPYQLSPSLETDYNALADCLKTMGLFVGSDTPYGSGYDLELAPTRIQGLVMFIRLLGEEQAALAYTDASVTFADVPPWALPYATYAYDKGYTKGRMIDAQGQVVFGSNDPMGPIDYMTFLLRALNYQEGTDFTWNSSVKDAQVLGVLTPGEVDLLTTKPFFRAQVVYLSYYALSTQRAGEGGTLLDRLISSGSVAAQTAIDAMSRVQVQRV